MNRIDGLGDCRIHWATSINLASVDTFAAVRLEKPLDSDNAFDLEGDQERMQSEMDRFTL
jgi:hypothetical protein